MVMNVGIFFFLYNEEPHLAEFDNQIGKSWRN